MFDTHGNHIRSIGRAGAGPGEFQQANGLAVDQRYRLWVVDRNRYSVFDSSGVFLTNHRRQVTLWGFIWKGGFSATGHLYDVTGVRSGTEWREAVVRYDSTAGFVDTLVVPTYSVEPVNWEFTSRTRRMFIAVPFARGLSWTFDPHGYVWAGVTSEYRLHQLSLAGDTIGVLQHDYQPVSVTSAERDSIVEAVRKRAPGAPVDASKIPSQKPAWVRLIVDDAGFIWVIPSMPRGTPGTVFDVFDPKRSYLGSATTQWSVSGFAPLLVRGDAMYAVITDKLDVPYVVRLSIEGRS